MGTSLKVIRMIIALLTLLILGYLAVNCLDLYWNSNREMLLESSFTYENVSQRLSGLLIPGVLYLLLIVIASCLERRAEKVPNVYRSSGMGENGSVRNALNQRDEHKINILRWVLIVAAVGLILTGCLDGGWYDVLVKAINICTECIGLG